MASLLVTAQAFEAIPWEDGQIVKTGGGIQGIKPTTDGGPERLIRFLPSGLAVRAVEQVCRGHVRERLNHIDSFRLLHDNRLNVKTPPWWHAFRVGFLSESMRRNSHGNRPAENL
jgi:hypothetical protein